MYTYQATASPQISLDKCFFFQQISSHVHDCSILPFCYTILLWCVLDSELSFDSNVFTICCKLLVFILSSLIKS